MGPVQYAPGGCNLALRGCLMLRKYSIKDLSKDIQPVFGEIQSPRHRHIVPPKPSTSSQTSTLVLWQLDTRWELLGHLQWHNMPTLRKIHHLL